MKKIISILSILAFLILPVKAEDSVIVSAVVNMPNHSPVIISVNPNNNPGILSTNATQNYSIEFRDDEKDTVTYTITPQDGFTNPISGTILPSKYTGNLAYVNFVYLSPATTPVGGFTKITVTLNDGHSVTSKVLNLYIY